MEHHKEDAAMDDPWNKSNTSTQTNAGHQTHRPPSPVPSCVSLKSNQSMDRPYKLSSEPASSGLKPQTDRPPSPVPSCVSVKSDLSMDRPLKFSSEQEPPGLKPPSPVPSCVSVKSDLSMDRPLKFSSEPEPPGLKLRDVLTQDQSRCGVCEQVLRDPVINTTCLHSFCRQCISSYWEQPGSQGDQACPQCGNKFKTIRPLQPPRHTNMPESHRHWHSELTSAGRNNTEIDEEHLRRVIENHKGSLKRRFENISEDITKPGIQKPLNEIYTELYITEGESEGVNKEHEVWQIELACRAQATEDTPINCNDIFDPLPGQKEHIRTVMTKGVAGIGKTVSVQKFILDWTEVVANQDVDFIFPLSFRELNLIKNDQYSLHSLLLDFHPELKELNDGKEYKDCQVLFIFDGLDESRLELKFEQNINISDVTDTSSVDALMKSLIQGTLLPSALIWITSRPAAASKIPGQYINRMTEVRGFNDPQKEAYFRRILSDESLANRIISHIKDAKSLHIMCHIPVFCWITATVLRQMVQRERDTQEIPKTLTEMFTHYLIIQITKKVQKYHNKTQTNEEQHRESQRETVLKLAELAFKHLENSNVMFYEEDLKECGLNVNEASVYSGMCTEIFREETVFQKRKVYCFVHLSIQEFLAALHVFVSYSNQMKAIGSFSCLEESLKLAVTKVLESQSGHLDLFLRFLMGISLENNQSLLKGLLKCQHNSSNTIKKICQYIKQLNKDHLSPERCIGLLQCLSEMNDNSIHDEIQQYLISPKGFQQILSPAHCSALAHMLLMSEKVLEEFDLKKYNTSDEGRRRLIPAVSCCRKAQLDGCKLNKMSCETVKRALQSANSLIYLDLSCNALGDSEVQIIFVGLTSLHCKLQTLRLGDCKLSGASCKMVATVLQSPNSLMELDLSHNDLGDSGAKILSMGLARLDCKLQTLRLSGCLISEEGCEYLASALTSNPSHLKELDLSYNHPGELGLNLLSARVEDPHCNLEILNVDHCGEIRLRPGVQKYACKLTLDQNTAHRLLSLSEGNVTCVSKEQPYPDHPERFDYWALILCKDGLSGRCYWEAECTKGENYIGLVYKSISRKGGGEESRLGFSEKSWCVHCTPDYYSAWHNKECTDIPAPSSGSRRVGVYLDWPAGTVSFYSVSSDTLTHLHTFHSTFTEPLYPTVWVWDIGSSVSLCQIT